MFIDEFKGDFVTLWHYAISFAKNNIAQTVRTYWQREEMQGLFTIKRADIDKNVSWWTTSLVKAEMMWILYVTYDTIINTWDKIEHNGVMWIIDDRKPQYDIDWTPDHKKAYLLLFK